MGDFKSKLPDLKELGSMSNKLFSGIKNAVTEIIQDYKEKRAEQEAQEKADEALKAKEAPVASKPAETPVEPTVEVKPVEPTVPVEPIEDVKAVEPESGDAVDEKNKAE